jgi:Mlc titration factor MtfA (ptsG expression regulator)
MTTFYLILAIAACAAGFIIWRNVQKRRALEELRQSPLPAEWVSTLDAGMPIYRRLPPDLRTKLHGYIQVFVATKSFEPCGELEEITDEMRVMVAAQASLLLLNDRNGCYDALGSVLLYPNAYRSRSTRYSAADEDGEPDVRLGESWGTGSVVLSWHHVRHGASNDDDGSNVVIHEFAHQLDQITGAADGLPVLKNRSRYPDWERVFTAAYERHVQRTEDGRRTVIDSYGATNPAEFFAVSTETFFEKPKILQKRYPELYGQLAQFYAVDPIAWEN